MDVAFEAKTKPLSTLSPFSYVPPRRNETQEMSYFYRVSKVTEDSMYDRVFHQAEGYNMRLRRDDRKHPKGMGLKIHEEERARNVPVLTSSEYGRHPAPACYYTGQHFARVACINAEFFMKNGITFNMEEV